MSAQEANAREALDRMQGHKNDIGAELQLRRDEQMEGPVDPPIDPDPPVEPDPEDPNPLFHEDWSAGFGAWGDRNTPLQHSIVPDPTGEDRGNVLRVDFADQNDAGWLAKWFDPPASGELHVRTSFYLDQWGNSDAVKLTNIAGNRSDSLWSSFGQAGVVPNGHDFFQSMCSMGSGAQADRKMLAYTYHPSQGGIWGDEDYDTVIRPEIGQWHQLDHYVRLNDVGQANGVVRVWLDEELVVELTGLEFRADSALDLNMLMLSFNGGGLSGNRLYYDDIHVYDGAPMSLIVLLEGGAGSGGGNGTTDTTPGVGAEPTVIDNLFDDGVDAAWTGTLGGAGISLISDPTGSFGGRQVAQHVFSINSGSHTDQDRYRYYEGYSASRTVHVAIDVEFTNVTQDGAQRKLIYLKGGRAYPTGDPWAVILTRYGSQLYLAGDVGGYNDYTNAISASGVVNANVPYRIELQVTTNNQGSANGVVRVWVTNLDTGVGSRTLIYESTSFTVQDATGTDFPYADRIQVGDQLDNGGLLGTLVADTRIFDRMMISEVEIGTWGLS